MKVRGRAKLYETLIPKVDTMGLDQVMRFKQESVPHPTWFYRRAKLNQFVISLSLIDDDIVLLRIK